MPADMKELIGQAAINLIRQGSHKRITVKDIVEECRITRQTFYYHFEDILDLMDWLIRRDMDVLLEQSLKEEPEEALKRFFQFVLDRRPLYRGGMNVSYYEAMERIVIENIRLYVSGYIDRKGFNVQGVDRKTALDYHVYAIIGALKCLRESDDVERTVHQLYLLLTGQAGFVRS